MPRRTMPKRTREYFTIANGAPMLDVSYMGPDAQKLMVNLTQMLDERVIWRGEATHICGQRIGNNGARGLCARHYSQWRKQHEQEEAA